MGVLRIITVGGIGYAAFRAWQRRQSRRGLADAEDPSFQTDAAVGTDPELGDAGDDAEADMHFGLDAGGATRVDDGSRTTPHGDPLQEASPISPPPLQAG